ncbi:MAG: hypothetical protein WDN69_08735 [Aliidongia sp.]
MALDDRAFEAGGRTERFIEEGGEALLEIGLGVNCRPSRAHDLAAGEVLQTNDVVKPGDRDFIPAVLHPARAP